MKLEILLCDLDAFFASVEQWDNPELKGRPVVVGGDPGSRGVVSTCSYEARQYGVRSAMPMKKALKLCPAAVILPVNMPRYKEVSGQVMEIFDRFTPDIEQVSIDEAYLAVRAGTGLETARKIRSAVREGPGLPLSIGVSSNKLLAKIACSLAKPDGVRALYPEDVEKVLWPLSVRFLPGVGPVTERKLNAFGLKTVGHLASFPPEALKSILGSPAAATELQAYAFGRDSRKLELDAVRKSISEEITFPRDVYAKDYILALLFDLSCELGYRLRSNGFKARTITLKIKFPDLSIKTRSLTLPEATASDEKIYEAAARQFARLREKPPWRLAGIRVSGLERESQLSLIPGGNPQEEKITPVLDMLRRRYGREAVFKGRRLLLLEKDDF